jgi:hypothetical protein
MSNQKTLSRLSFVAIVLLAAALPCLAQTKSTPARNNQTGDMNLRQETEIAVLGSERLNVYKAEPRTVSDIKVGEQQRNLARARFQQSIDQASSATPTFPTTISESDWQKARSLGNDDESSATKRITFVPSRGQKLPE